MSSYAILAIVDKHRNVRTACMYCPDCCLLKAPTSLHLIFEITSLAQLPVLDPTCMISIQLNNICKKLVKTAGVAFRFAAAAGAAAGTAAVC
eukprot:3701761-Pleurochrysis_carterae.AAC.6